eukprot:4761162-Amphidinium_carterae.1
MAALRRKSTLVQAEHTSCSDVGVDLEAIHRRHSARCSIRVLYHVNCLTSWNMARCGVILIWKSPSCVSAIIQATGEFKPDPVRTNRQMYLEDADCVCCP